MSQTQKLLELNGRKITLIGTAHVSSESVQEVKDTILAQKPDCVAVELDEKRCDSIKNPEKYRELDIIKVLRKKEGFLLLANLIMAAFQKRTGQKSGVVPGAEMLAALNTAEESGIPTVLADRPVQITLRRAWAKSSASGKSQMLAALVASSFSSEEISSEEIENLKKSSEMDSLMQELAQSMPTIKQVLIDERDHFIASRIWEACGNNMIAVLGAGHLAGVESSLKKIAAGQLSTNTEEINRVPDKKLSSKIITWLIPALIIALIAFSFIRGGKEIGTKMVLSWILYNSIFAGLGAAVAAAHPLTILVSALGAPITSLCPFIGVGFVAGAVQTFLCKPQIKDLESLTDDAGSIKGFYKNKLLKILLVFFLSSIGSSIGTFAGGADIFVKLTSIISSMFKKF